jgi:hypothetical protein
MTNTLRMTNMLRMTNSLRMTNTFRMTNSFWMTHRSVHLFHYYTGSLKEVYTVSETISIPVDHTLDSGLDYEFSTFHARRSGHIEGRILAAVAGLCDLGNCIRLSMKDIRFCNPVLVFAYVLEA